MAITEPAAMTTVIARNVALLRHGQRLSYEQLARRAAVSKGVVVQIEQARSNPNIATLCRLASALGVAVVDLLAEDSGAGVRLVRADEVPVLWSGPNGGTARLLAGTRGPDMLELWEWVLHDGERYDGAAHASGTREIVHVVEGMLAIEVEGRRFDLDAGDGMTFAGDRRHAYLAVSDLVRFTMAVHEPPSTWTSA
ncbi:XRE family transcriptional regulator [Thalassobaculum sp.]|uniref:helix-turn-helix domain-containing protein n=1 Tax=Thalassobaculum sp. TaxID=2022740 RepID=UPI0032EEBCE6